jgi:hypothetical protein
MNIRFQLSAFSSQSLTRENKDEIRTQFEVGNGVLRFHHSNLIAES